MQKLRDLKNAQAGNSWFWVPWILPHIGGLVTLMYQYTDSDSAHETCVIQYIIV